jgi:hypothetical protein
MGIAYNTRIPNAPIGRIIKEIVRNFLFEFQYFMRGHLDKVKITKAPCNVKLH